MVLSLVLRNDIGMAQKNTEEGHRTGSEVLSSYYIYFSNEAKSWIDALEYCKNSGSILAEITNDNVWNTVKTSIRDKVTNMEDGAWVGLERSIFANKVITWKWVLHGTESSSRWHKSFPINKFNYHCGKIIWAQGEGYKLLDDSCRKKLPFICQM
ncbi:hypothetical protein GBF38_012436 [Nibea albiflora]|uniref:Uncharacterized protein n=1 Tax=Nibea albiflora TaxID=240163 RepID=A0ACB7EJJ7_NIBAL|nr:hypothetical protein GBF38_012436 [Nibea albiflora]